MKGSQLARLGAKEVIIKTALESFYLTGLHHLARPLFAGLGAILTFHRVRPASPAPFQPNTRLEVTPAYLNATIDTIRRAELDIVSLDEARVRILEGTSTRRFVVLTFDDGYRDNLEFAWPILKRHGAPFTVFVPSAFADGKGELWWLALEQAISKQARISLEWGGQERVFDCSTTPLKEKAFQSIYWWLRQQPSEDALRAAVRKMSFDAGINMEEQCRAECMNWDELCRMAEDPLVTIGGHTVDHLILEKTSSEGSYAAMQNGAQRLEEKLGKKVRHFAYPFGDRSSVGLREFDIASRIGFETAVTTRRGVLFAEHANHLTALPRISVNGKMQRPRYINVYLSGAPTAFANGFQRVIVN